MVNIGVPKFKWQEIPMSNNLNYTDLGFNNKYLKKGFGPLLGDLNIDKISELEDEHFAKKYLINRAIPPQFLSYLYYTEDFKNFSNFITFNCFI